MIIILSISNFKKNAMRKKSTKKNKIRSQRDKKVITNSIVENSKKSTKRPILLITLKSLFIITIIGAAIYYSDYKGYFSPDETNNHTKRKWDAYYEFSKNNNIDILLLGNSHLYSGINPKNLSSTLGVNAFILASPGTSISDTYYGLKEALKKSDPKLVVIETFGINEFNQYNLKEGALSDQFKSFNARKDFFIKMASTPLLFKSDNYFYAWSNTLRNHDFIFKDTLQLSKNRAIINKRPKKDNKLYLGRFVRFQSGLENNILAKYDTLGAPVKGSEYSYSKYAEGYVREIVELCEEKDIELIFLTLPMYYKHIENYRVWNEKLNEIINKYSNKWLNMQNPYDTASFTKMCFENTYSNNQHMTYNGSLIATYKLAEYIKSEIKVKLPNRKNDTKWNHIFYGQEGYFENNPVMANDKINKLLCEDFTTNNVVLKEVSIIKPEKGENKIIIAKIEKDKKDLSKCKLRLAVNFIQNKQLKVANIDLRYDVLHEITDEFIFKAIIKPIEIKEVKAAMIICD